MTETNPLEELIAALRPAERRAVALVGLMLRQRNSQDGEGLFTGAGRYQTLQARLRQSAEISRSVGQFWDRLHLQMGWPVGPMRHDADTLALIAEASDDGEVLEQLARRGLSVIMLARQLERSRRGLAAGQDARSLDPPPLADPLDIFDRDPAGIYPPTADLEPSR